MRTQPLVLVSMAAIFAAMLGRAGFVDWPQILGISTTVIALVLAVLLTMAVAIGFPMAALYALFAFLRWATTPKHKSASLPTSL